MRNSANDDNVKVSSLDYVAPSMEILEIMVEQGYAGSQLPGRIPEFW